ncbi:hypothetical protein ACLK1Z_02510 [Escherichia coli]
MAHVAQDSVFRVAFGVLTTQASNKRSNVLARSGNRLQSYIMAFSEMINVLKAIKA